MFAKDPSLDDPNIDKTVLENWRNFPRLTVEELIEKGATIDESRPIKKIVDERLIRIGQLNSLDNLQGVARVLYKCNMGGF